MLVSGWYDPLVQLQHELVQLQEEGYILSPEIREEAAMLHPDADAYSERIEKIYKKLENLPMRPDWKYEEPDELEEIRALRPEGPRKFELKLSDAELLEHFHGAWRGRCVGCALGKPVECKSRSWIRDLLIRQGDWELHDYLRSAPELWCPRSQRENINCMEPDDDIHYTLVGLRVLETKGADFKWHDVADRWNSSLPYNAICTAETQAILNYNMRHPRFCRPSGWGATPAFTRRFNNPYREWIGAAIRADFWGYAAAGNPELAAEFAGNVCRGSHQCGLLRKRSGKAHPHRSFGNPRKLPFCGGGQTLPAMEKGDSDMGTVHGQAG